MTPRVLHILTQRYTVTHIPDRETLLIYGGEDENEVGKNAMGLTNSGSQEITLRVQPGISHDAERDTLLHEVLHATFAATALDQKMSEDDAEDLIGRLAPALLSVLRENPHLVSYLQERDDD